MTWEQWLQSIGLAPAAIARLLPWLKRFPIPPAGPPPAPAGTLSMLDRAVPAEGLALSPAERGTQSAGTPLFSSLGDLLGGRLNPMAIEALRGAVDTLLGRGDQGNLSLPAGVGLGGSGESGGLMPGEPGYYGPSEPATPPTLPEEPEEFQFGPFTAL